MAAIDPTLLALLSIFGGALLTAAAGFWGAWRQSKREHARWVRERRYEVYVDQIRSLRALEAELAAVARLSASADRLSKRASVLLERLGAEGDEPDDIDAIHKESEQLTAKRKDQDIERAALLSRLSELQDEVGRRIAPFYLLGPAEVRDAAREVAGSLRDPSVDQHNAFVRLESSMRDAIMIDDFWDRRERRERRRERDRRGRPPA